MRVLHLHCPSCGYDVRGVRLGDCPECGARVQRRVLVSRLRDPHLRIHRILFQLLTPTLIFLSFQLPTLISLFVATSGYTLIGFTLCGALPGTILGFMVAIGNAIQMAHRGMFVRTVVHGRATSTRESAVGTCVALVAVQFFIGVVFISFLVAFVFGKHRTTF